MTQSLMVEGAWTSTTDADGVANTLRAASRILVLTHTKPDGDALGSTLALVRSLQRIGKEATAWYVGPMPRWASQVIAGTPVRILDSATAAALLADPAASGEQDPDAIVIVDTGSWMQIEELKPFVATRTAKVIVVDHHLSGNADISSRRCIDGRAAAAAEIMAGVCVRLLGKKSAVELPLDIASALYLGLATDTGWFHFSNTRPNTLRLAADLVDAGVDFPKLFEMIEQQDRPARLRLVGRAMNSLELFSKDTVAMMTLTRRDFDETHGDSEDTGGFANYALAVAGMQVAVILTEAAGREGKGPLTKVSFRSKPGPDAVDVAAICQKLGGGGHARAAGVKVMMGVVETKLKVLEALGVSATEGVVAAARGSGNGTIL